MKIAIVADSHFSERSRFEECIRIHDWIAEYVLDNEVNVLLHAGDVFNAKSTPRERKAVADWLQRVTRQCPVIISRGNHDALGDLKLFERLTGENFIKVVEDFGIQNIRFDKTGETLGVACVAWPRKASLLDATGSSDVHGAFRQMAAGLNDMIKDNDVRVMLAHAMVTGSVTSTGQPLVGCDMEVGLEDLAAASDVDIFALGHIHMRQDWHIGEASVVYPGSPRRTAFGEVEKKGFYLFDIDKHSVQRTFIETPATDMVLLKADWMDGALVGDHRFTDVMSAEVRLRYTVPADERDAARIRAQEAVTFLKAQGAVDVKLEEVVGAATRSRAGADEVSKAKTLPDKLRAYWGARGEALGEQREDRLLGKLIDLEGEV